MAKEHSTTAITADTKANGPKASNTVWVSSPKTTRSSIKANSPRANPTSPKSPQHPPRKDNPS
jgi:hypothetical protein